MLSYRLGTVNDFHWGFKPVLSYSKPHSEEIRPIFFIFIQRCESFYLHMEFQTSWIRWFLWKKKSYLHSWKPKHCQITWTSWITDKFPPEHIPSRHFWHLGHYSLQSFFFPRHFPSCHFSTRDIFPPVVFPPGTYSLPSFFHPIHFLSCLYIHVICATSEIKHFIDWTQIETILMFCTEIKLFVTVIENNHH